MEKLIEQILFFWCQVGIVHLWRYHCACITCVLVLQDLPVNFTWRFEVDYWAWLLCGSAPSWLEFQLVIINVIHNFVGLCRSKNDVEKRVLSNVNESRVYDHDGNFTVTSESCSWDAEEKGCSSDNQIFSLRKDDKLKRR